MKMLKSKMKRVEEKIRTYFEDKLKQEISYFEKQLQDQHEEDLSTIIKLQHEVARLQSILGREQAQLLRGQPLRSQRPDIIDLNRIPAGPSGPRPAGIARKTRLSDGDASDKVTQGCSSGTDSAESSNEEDRQETSGLRRVPSAKDKSISALVEESARKTDSVAYMRRQSSDGARTSLRRSGSTGALILPNRPLSRRNRMVSETPPTSPVIKTQPGGLFSELTPSTSTVTQSLGRDHLQVGEPDAPKTRRKSLTMLLRPIFFGDNTAKTDKSRRRSVVTTMPVSPPQDSKPEKKKRGPSLLQRPLPGINVMQDAAQVNIHEDD